MCVCAELLCFLHQERRHPKPTPLPSGHDLGTEEERGGRRRGGGAMALRGHPPQEEPAGPQAGLGDLGGIASQAS